MDALGKCNVFNAAEEEDDDDDDSTQGERDGAGIVQGSDVKGQVVRTGEKITDDELEDFRRKWKSEIHNQNANNNQSNQSVEQINNDEKEVTKSASQTLEINKNKPKCGHVHRMCGKYVDEEEGVDDDDDEVTNSDDDSIKMSMDNVVCKFGYNQTSTHISDLPLEVLDLIFKWVVSSYLDVRSLEMLSMVCKSFYLLARDEDLWKAICMRTWEKASLSPGYNSYRQMFVERPHVMFNGVYISKVTYFRQGEQSLDGFYKPFHLVKYYRYMRFHPEGKVCMFMSPEDPSEAVYHLKNKSEYVPGLQCGYYKLSDDKVSLVLKKIPEPSVKMKRIGGYYGDYEQTFFLEMSLKTIKHKRNGKLSWLKYFMHRINKSTGEITTMTFDITDSMYPPFYFYPVRSFSTQSELPL